MQRLIIALLALAILAQGGVASGATSEGATPVKTTAVPSSAGVSDAVDQRSIIGSKMLAERLSRTDGDALTLAFTGDILIHGNVTAAARRNGTPFDFRPMFADVRHLIGGADLAVCHLEVPLSVTSSDLASYPLFNAPAEVADALSWAGFDACSTASNHSYDQGTDGVVGTLRVLATAGIDQAGMVERITEWWRPTLYEVGGLTVGHVSATYWLNGLRLPTEQQWLVQLLDEDEVLAVARRAKAEGADLVVVSMHCCTEYRRSPTARQVEISHRLVASPYVDLVVTHHSHVVGPVEKVGDEFVLHGLGNFLSGQTQSRSLRNGVIAVANATREGGEWRFASIDVIPTQVTRGNYRIEIADRETAARTLASLGAMGVSVGFASTEARSMTQAQRGLLE